MINRQCKYFDGSDGSCVNGDNCKFIHDVQNIPQIKCKFFDGSDGSCINGANCKFIHDSNQRDTIQIKCKFFNGVDGSCLSGDNCNFIHNQHYATKICGYFNGADNSCTNQNNCNFLHDQSLIQNYEAYVIRMNSNITSDGYTIEKEQLLRKKAVKFGLTEAYRMSLYDIKKEIEKINLEKHHRKLEINITANLPDVTATETLVNDQISDTCEIVVNTFILADFMIANSSNVINPVDNEIPQVENEIRSVPNETRCVPNETRCVPAEKIEQFENDKLILAEIGLRRNAGEKITHREHLKASHAYHRIHSDYYYSNII